MVSSRAISFASGGSCARRLEYSWEGAIDTWVTIQSVNQYGVAGPAGDIHIILEFFGPHGIAYPQHQPGIDSFDDSMRIQVLKKEGGEISGEHEKKDEALAMDVMDDIDKPKMQRDKTFSDSEIEAAFRFIDLDKNGYIGANEIRHILICMGEMITDEEVDMMINMVDSDGDGQVGFYLFIYLFRKKKERKKRIVPTLLSLVPFFFQFFSHAIRSSLVDPITITHENNSIRSTLTR